LDNEDYYCPDYRQGYVYKKSDKLKSKPVKLIKILNKALNNNQEKFNQLKKEFDERLKTSRKTVIDCLICITHNPYDVAGMSTDRNWTSCMELDYGEYKDTPLKQVQYGRNVCIFN
jgi:Fe-S oxidoreductase